MLSGVITFMYTVLLLINYGRYFPIDYQLSEIEIFLLLAERAKENIWFEIVLTFNTSVNTSFQTRKINPLSPMSDQHQISPCNINAL